MAMTVLGVIVLAALRGFFHAWRMWEHRQPPQIPYDAPRPHETIEAYYGRMEK